MSSLFMRFACALSLVVCASMVYGAADTWDGNGGVPPNGNWGNVNNWADNSTPTNSDTAAFSTAQTYTVGFAATPAAIQALTVSAGNITFSGTGAGSQSLLVNSATGTMDAAINGGSTLTLGTSGNELHLTIGNNLTVNGASTLNVNFGSQVNASDLLLAQTGGNGTIVVDGIGSQLNVTSAITPGLNGNTGTLTYRNDATGTLAAVTLANSGNAASVGILNVESDADLITGSMNIGTSASAAATGTLNIQGINSTVTLSGSSTLTVGDDTAGIGVINIGTTSYGSQLITGTGLFTINANGSVNIGAAGNTGRLDVSGNFTIDGGSLICQEFTSQFFLADGKTMTIQNGGTASFSHSSLETAPNAIYNITGAGSVLEKIDYSNFTIREGAQVNVSSGGALYSVSDIDIAVGFGGGGNGTLVVDGTGSSVTSDGLSNFWASHGYTATVTFSNSAQGTFNGSLYLADDDDAGTTATVDVLSGADLYIDGSLQLATSGGITTSATLNIQGSGSTLTKTDFGFFDVGGSVGSAVINIGTTTSGAVFTADSTLNIEATGVVNIGSASTTGTLNADSGIVIDGGTLNRYSSGLFFLGAGSGMTVSNGGSANFIGANFSTASNATYNITDLNSSLSTSGIGSVLLYNNAEMNVSFGGSVSSSARIDIGAASSGTLTVDGTGSSANAGTQTSFWGQVGGTADVTFSDHATGSFTSGINLAESTTAATSAVVNILSGADLTTGTLRLAHNGGSTTSAVLTVSEPGSSLNITSSSQLVIGHASTGSAILNVQNGAELTVGTGGSTTLNPTGTLNINVGYVNLKTLIDNGGTLNFTAGSLSYIGDLAVGFFGLLGVNLTLESTRSLTLTGTTTIDAFNTLTIDGGTFNTGSIVNNGSFAFDSGFLGFVTAGGSMNSSFVSNSPNTTVNIFADNISIGNAASFTGFNHMGTLNVGANTVTLNSAGYARLGILTTVNAGTINAPNGVTLPSGSNLVGNGNVNTRFTGESGAVVQADGALALGSAASPAGFNFAGELRTLQHAVTLNSSSQAGLGNLTTLGNGSNPGTLIATNGLVVDFAEAITGYGTITSTNTLAKRTIINGIAQGNSPSQPLTFTGYVKGVGSFDNVNFTGTFSPGLSPTTLTVGSIALSPTSTLIMELAGTTPGLGHDQIQASGNLTLDGILSVVTIDGFVPSYGDSFNLFDWAAGLSGTFDALNLPMLPTPLAWRTSNLYTTGTISVIGALLGDTDHDGDVDADDLANVKDAFGDASFLSPGDGDWDSDSDIDDLVAVKNNFGTTLPPGITFIPEPASAWLLTFGGLTLLKRLRSTVGRRQ